MFDQRYTLPKIKSVESLLIRPSMLRLIVSWTLKSFLVMTWRNQAQYLYKYTDHKCVKIRSDKMMGKTLLVVLCLTQAALVFSVNFTDVDCDVSIIYLTLAKWYMEPTIVVVAGQGTGVGEGLELLTVWTQTSLFAPTFGKDKFSKSLFFIFGWKCKFYQNSVYLINIFTA